MPIVVLNEIGFAVSNGAGAATVKLGPTGAREIWHPDGATVSLIPGSAAPVNEATCQISFGDQQTKRLLDACVDGSSGDSTGRVQGVAPRVGQYIWADWTGGDVGVTFALTVTGTKEV